ncbi:MAG: hypothetical protein ACM37W_26500 [Actinomycetota bacterium]
MDVYINGKKIRLKPTHSIGKGGEADVYDIGKGKALKLFKQPDHPDYQNLPEQQQAARDRLAEHQYKLRLFPSNLPSRVIGPQELATDVSGNTIVGYTMQLLADAEVLLKYSDRSFRQSGIPQQRVVEIFRDLHTTVATLHQAGVIIGDFNDLNVLVRETEAYLIDADSFQTPTFLCRVFTNRFVDPLLCDSQAAKPILAEPYTLESDWYAFAVMFMQSLLFVHPFGGVYRPKNSAQRIPQEARCLQGITIFHPEVIYPKPAIPYKVLPDELLHYFYQVFEKDERGQFPRQLLDNLQWTQCPQCRREHARSICPDCTPSVPVATVVLTKVRGNVTATRVFFTEGVILFATLQSGNLRWIYYEKGEFKRENDSVILSGELDAQLQFRIQGKSTILGKQGQVITLTPGQPPRQLAAERFDANEWGRYWIEGGQLLRDGSLGAEYIGDVLARQTQFWIGEHFGFGFYRAGNLKVAFVFDSKRPGICDRVQLPPDSGQLIDATCTFSKDRCWFFWSTQEQGRTVKRCAIVRSDGTVEASLAAAGDDSWLGKTGEMLRGQFAVGNFLLVATDEGIIRVEVQNNQIFKAKEFPDTEPFVDSHCELFAAQGGLYIVKPQEIVLLKIS